MKTLTTLTAVAALIAGVSIASAQMSPSTGSPNASGSSGMAGSSQQATGSGKYCLEASSGGALSCKYASLAACQKDAKAQGQTCAPNPNAGTTGSKQ
jgi:hypothetical protein